MINGFSQIAIPSCLAVLCVSVAHAFGQQAPPDTAAQQGTLSVNVSDARGARLPCRMRLLDSDGKPVRPPSLPFWRGHFVCEGNVRLMLRAGDYSLEIERGPEYQRVRRSVSVKPDQTTDVQTALQRIAHLAAKGWYSGELHIHRKLDEMDLLVRAEDIHVAPVITWWNKRNLWSTRDLPSSPLIEIKRGQFVNVLAGEDEREGGALLYFGLNRPLEITDSTREYPSPMKYVEQARQQQGVWIDIEKPFWWDVPIWLASGHADSIGLANNHMCHSSMYVSEAWGKPRDTNRFPPPRGNGQWTQEIYYQILNCGIRIPPSAGSASGVLPNPVGYNRAYVHLDTDFSYDAWWQGLKRGRSFVTNGPLLICRAHDQLPGHIFRAEAGPLAIPIEVTLTSNDTVPAVEIIKNGQIVQRVSAYDHRNTPTLSLGPVEFQQSGWFLIRAIADVKQTFRFASTAPFYVEIGKADRRISRRSAQFFLDWVNQRMQRVKLNDPKQRQEVLDYHEQAREFWRQRVNSANAD